MLYNSLKTKKQILQTYHRLHNIIDTVIIIPCIYITTNFMSFLLAVWSELALINLPKIVKGSKINYVFNEKGCILPIQCSPTINWCVLCEVFVYLFGKTNHEHQTNDNISLKNENSKYIFWQLLSYHLTGTSLLFQDWINIETNRKSLRQALNPIICKLFISNPGYVLDTPNQPAFIYEIDVQKLIMFITDNLTTQLLESPDFIFPNSSELVLASYDYQKQNQNKHIAYWDDNYAHNKKNNTEENIVLDNKYFEITSTTIPIRKRRLTIEPSDDEQPGTSQNQQEKTSISTTSVKGTTKKKKEHIVFNDTIDTSHQPIIVTSNNTTISTETTSDTIFVPTTSEPITTSDINGTTVVSIDDIVPTTITGDTSVSIPSTSDTVTSDTVITNDTVTTTSDNVTTGDIVPITTGNTSVSIPNINDTVTTNDTVTISDINVTTVPTTTDNTSVSILNTSDTVTTTSDATITTTASIPTTTNDTVTTTSVPTSDTTTSVSISTISSDTVNTTSVSITSDIGDIVPTTTDNTSISILNTSDIVTTTSDAIITTTASIPTTDTVNTTSVSITSDIVSTSVPTNTTATVRPQPITDVIASDINLNIKISNRI